MNISCVAYMFGLKPKTLHYWYKEELSGYREAKAAGAWGGKKIKVLDKDTGEVTGEKPVPIAKTENMGADMTIDEKQIGKKMYTVMTNAQTGKIALLAPTMKPEELASAIGEYLGPKTAGVKSVSLDMSPSYKKLCRDMFPSARLIVDKFHVVKHLMDALQQVRKQIKAQCLTNDKATQKEAVGGGVWTEIEMLERGRYILCKMEPEWDEYEKEIMVHLFKKYPVLGKSFELAQKLRAWYNKKQVGKNLDFIERDLYEWCDEVLQSKIQAFKAVKKMIEKHWDDIINYFREGQTNAKAENMNSRIQRFLANNFGIKDRDFFLYRLAGYFS